MKTLTEFNGSHFTNLAKQQVELLAAGKTPEEMPAALGEVLKLEGDKLKAILAAADLVNGKTANLKRVVVAQLAEGEKPAGGLVERDGLYFAVEYFPTGIQKAPPREERDPRGGRGGKGGKKGGAKGGREGGAPRGDKPGRGDGAGPRGPRPEGVSARPALPKPALPKPNVVAAKPAATPTSDQQ